MAVVEAHQLTRRFDVLAVDGLCFGRHDATVTGFGGAAPAVSSLSVEAGDPMPIWGSVLVFAGYAGALDLARAEVVA